MAEFNFYGTWSDSWKVMERLLSLDGARFVPDVWYQKPEVRVFIELSDELKCTLRKKRRGYLFPVGIEMGLAGIVRQKSGPVAGLYRVDGPRIGENLDLTLPGCYDSGGQVCLACGSLSYAREYYVASEDTWRKPSDALKEFYATALRRAKQTMTRFRPHSKIVWIGEEARALCDRGEAQIVDRDIL